MNWVLSCASGGRRQQGQTEAIQKFHFLPFRFRAASRAARDSGLAAASSSWSVRHVAHGVRADARVGVDRFLGHPHRMLGLSSTFSPSSAAAASACPAAQTSSARPIARASAALMRSHKDGQALGARRADQVDQARQRAPGERDAEGNFRQARRRHRRDDAPVERHRRAPARRRWRSPRSRRS